MELKILALFGIEYGISPEYRGEYFLSHEIPRHAYCSWLGSGIEIGLSGLARTTHKYRSLSSHTEEN
jgi:hypothetical protein